jgi:hypothetical protein
VSQPTFITPAPKRSRPPSSGTSTVSGDGGPADDHRDAGALPHPGPPARFFVPETGSAAPANPQAGNAQESLAIDSVHRDKRGATVAELPRQALPVVSERPSLLSDRDVDRIARRTVELLIEREGADPGRLVDAAYIARRFDVDRAWVYQHKVELGAVPMGRGKRPRLRFDLVLVEAALDEIRAAQFRPPPRRGRPRKRDSVPGITAGVAPGR